MNAQSASRNRSAARNRNGYSLMELMIVVAITGILAAIAIPTFNGYVQKSRTSEAVDFLGVIKLRQEAYRAEFGTYLVCNSVNLPTFTHDAFTPDAANMTNGTTHEFITTASPGSCFNTIGAKPGGWVRFGYAWAAGLPAQASALPAAYGLSANTYDHYFIAQAVTDLDGDGTMCTYELTSFTRSLWYSDPKGWD